MDQREPLKNLATELTTRRFKTNASLRGVVEKGPLAPYGEMRQGKVDMSPLKAVDIDARNLPKGVLRDFGAVRIKSQSSSFVGRSSVHTIVHTERETGRTTSQIVRDVPDNDGPVTEPVRIVREYKPRPNSPFKRAAKAAASVVIVRK